ncbi:MAG: hypothetical protein ACOH2E_08705 [Candidatus Paracaedibacter sp.]
MRNLAYGIIVASSLITQESLAADSQWWSHDLGEIFQQCKVARNAQAIPGILNQLSGKKSELCKEINDERFFEAALSTGCGATKYTAIRLWCSNTVYERDDKKAAIQKAKPEEKKEDFKLKSTPRKIEPSKLGTGPTGPTAELEGIKLRPVNREKEKGHSVPEIKKDEFANIKLRPVNLEKKEGQSVEATQNQLKEAQAAVSANIKMIEEKKDSEIMIKLEKLKVEEVKAQESIKIAKEDYDNLSVGVMGMRIDIEEGINKNWAKGQENKTPEEFVSNLNGEITGSRIHLDNTSLQTFNALKALLANAHKNYEAARLDLVRINRELLELTH